MHLVDVSRAALERPRAVGACRRHVVAHQAALRRARGRGRRRPRVPIETDRRTNRYPEPARASACVKVSPKRVARSGRWRCSSDRTSATSIRPAPTRCSAGFALALRPGDAFLLGADLVKPERDLLLAYDDPLGVTAAFNRNLLVRINRELGADFDLSAFRHRAIWNAARVARRDAPRQPQAAARRASRRPASTSRSGRRDRSGPRARTEYRASEVLHTLERCGFRRRAQWVDDEGAVRGDAGGRRLSDSNLQFEVRSWNSKAILEVNGFFRNPPATSRGSFLSTSTARFMARMSRSEMAPASRASAGGISRCCNSAAVRTIGTASYGGK